MSSEYAGLTGGLLPFLGSSLPWPAFGTPGGAWSRSGTGSRPGWEEPRIPHRCPGAWPCPFFPGCCAASIPCALESGPAGVRTRGVSPAWLPALLVSALPVASASWVGAWPSSGWSSSVWPWGFWWLPWGGGGVLGPYLAVGLLEWEAVDKYMSFRRVHPPS